MKPSQFFISSGGCQATCRVVLTVLSAASNRSLFRVVRSPLRRRFQRRGAMNPFIRQLQQLPITWVQTSTTRRVGKVNGFGGSFKESR